MAAPKCLAKGCNHKTRNAHGFCFQHADMHKHSFERGLRDAALVCRCGAKPATAYAAKR